MRIRFWGTRGSIPTPGAGTNRYGGNTSCVEVRTDGGTVLVFDCGTGARPLGAHLLQNAGGAPLDIHLLLGHTHWDHIQGFPFFGPAFVPGGKLTVYGPGDSQRSLSEALSGQMQYTYFPVNLEQLGAQITYRGLHEEEFMINDVLVRTQYLNHPAPTLAYRIEVGGIVMVYSTDHEQFAPQLFRSGTSRPSLEAILHEGDRRHAAFIAGADVLIHDAQYIEEEYPQKRNWGHSTLSYVVNIALAAEVKHTVLFHHDPTHDDGFLDMVLERARGMASAGGNPPMRVHVAAEGREIVLPESGHLTPAAPPDQRPEIVPILGRTPRLLVVEDDKDSARLLMETLRHDGYEVQTVHDGMTALDTIRNDRPDLVLLDLGLPGMDGLSLMEQVREDPETNATVMLVLTGHDDEHNAAASFAAGASDFLLKPYTPAQVRTRVRGWLTRIGLV